MPTKVYAPQRSGSEAPIHEFTMIFVRDGTDEHHDFEARPSLGWADVTGLVPLLGGTNDDDLIRRSLAPIDKLIRRCLRNDDGTPEKWTPRVVTPDDDDEQSWFTAPNGDHHTGTALLATFTTFAAGSSRRRWVHLMEHDDDITVEPEQVMNLMRDLMEVASGRPTKSSADSSGS